MLGATNHFLGFQARTPSDISVGLQLGLGSGGKMVEMVLVRFREMVVLGSMSYFAGVKVRMSEEVVVVAEGQKKRHVEPCVLV